LAENKEKPRLIVICGPTAVGKTALSIQLAKELKTVILSADSRQFYKELNAATAKPTPEELSAVKHYFIDSLSIFDNYSAGQFERDTTTLLHALFKTRRDVIVVGGSGLYIKALVQGIDDFPEVETFHADALQQLLDTKGLAFLQNELKEKDPNYFKEVDLNNSRRVLRALAVIRQSNQPYSSFLKSQRNERDFQTVYVRLGINRKSLYERIDNRVYTFMEMGLLEEAQNLHPYKHLKALQTVGYTELFDFFEGKYSTMEEAIEKIKQHSRNYAKRQETWLNRQVSGPIWMPTDYEGIFKYLKIDQTKENEK